MLVAHVRPIDTYVDIENANRAQQGSSMLHRVRCVLHQAKSLGQRQGRNQGIKGLFTPTGHPDDLLFRIDGFQRLVEMDALHRSRQRLGKAFNASGLRVDEARVISHALVGQSQRAADDFVEGRFGNRPADPVRGYRPKVLLPELLVVGKHEVFGNAGTESPAEPIHESFSGLR